MRRFHCDTANWHVFARGARRLQLLRDDQDCAQFTKCLAYSLKRSGCILWAFALMTNHYHLVLRGSSDQLTACMRRLNAMYSRYHNKRYGLDGHTFDGPYQAFRQATPLLMLRCIAYVFFNPVKGGLCINPEDYPWSGCRAYLGLPGSPLPIKANLLIDSLGLGPQQGWARFHEAMLREAKRSEPTKAGRLTMTELHMTQFEWLLEAATAMADQLPDEDPSLVAMYWARSVGITPRAMAKVLGLESTASIRDRLYRLEGRLQKNPDLRKRYQMP
jgi:REP element-mobilizing transposase RayT